MEAKKMDEYENEYENELTNISLSDMPKKDKMAMLIDLTEDVAIESIVGDINCVFSKAMISKIKQCAKDLME